MTLENLFDDTFLGKINSLLSFIPAETLTLLGALIVVVIGIAIWHAVVG